MSVLLLTKRLAKHGRYFLRSYWSREIHANILEQTQLKTRSKFQPISSTNVVRSTQTLKSTVTSPRISSSGLFRVGQHARKLFIDNILNRVTTNYSEEFRQKATKKLFYGDSAPFFALVGVTLASGSGVLSKEDELEGICWEIREAAGRLQLLWNKDEVSSTLNNDFNIDNLDVGPPIAKGCSAVVYAASFKTDEGTNSEPHSLPMQDITNRGETQLKGSARHKFIQPELISPLQNMSRFVHNFGGSVDYSYVYSQSSAATVFVEEIAKVQQQQPLHKDTHKDFAGMSNNMRSVISLDKSVNSSLATSNNRYPLALKMMFNYDIQSNALSILRAMYKETVPARNRRMNASPEEWEHLLQHQTIILPPHPNIVCMFGFFCDKVRSLPDGHLLYPIAQPQRINPHGYGRNMSLFLLMKRYDLSLRALLDKQVLSTRNKLLLLAQLLEAVTHISRHGIAHRDLKSDNVLIEINDDNTPPVLVLSDFGCCLADKVHGLQVPYCSYDIDKGGNAALMAPEIVNKQPGPFAVLNYAKADLWACGAIAYEIFDQPNPFYSSSGGLAYANGHLTLSLRNNDYKEGDLPPLNDSCPVLVQQLIYNILNPNPSKRISPDIAANVLQLFLWAPSKWLKTGGIPNSPEILQWLLSLTTKIMCEGRPHVLYGGVHTIAATSPLSDELGFQQSGRRTYVEYLLICSFLARAHLRRMRGALNWIQSVVG